MYSFMLLLWKRPVSAACLTDRSVSFDIYDDRRPQCCRKHNNTEIIIFIKAGDPAVFPCGDFYVHLRIFLPKVQF